MPLIWRPAPADRIAPAAVPEPVGHLDIAPTILAACGLPVPGWMQGRPLPRAAGDAGRERAITEWIDSYDGNDIVMRTMVRDGWLVTEYGATGSYAGTEGELYDLAEDPHQWRNLWAEPARAALKAELLADLHDNLPEGRAVPLEKIAPV